MGFVCLGVGWPFTFVRKPVRRRASGSLADWPMNVFLARGVAEIVGIAAEIGKRIVFVRLRPDGLGDARHRRSHSIGPDSRGQAAQPKLMDRPAPP